MTREAVQVPDGIPLENRFVQQLIASWLGLAGDGTAAQLAGIPLRQTSVSDAALYAGDFRNRGTGGLHLRATHSSGSPVLFDVTDSGVLLSTGGAAASNSLVYQKMVVGWTGTAATVPSGYTIVAASKNAFPYGANADGDLGATGGAATYDISHTHTGPSHAHTAATGASGTAASGASGTGATSADGTGQTTLDGTGQTGGDGAFSSTDRVGVSPQAHFDNNDTNHTHSGPAHRHNGPSHTHTGPSHTHTGPSHTHTISADGTGATGSSGSAVQSILPPFWRCYWIERTTA